MAFDGFSRGNVRRGLCPFGVDTIVNIKIGVSHVFFSFHCRRKVKGVSGSVACSGVGSSNDAKVDQVVFSHHSDTLDFSLNFVF